MLGSRVSENANCQQFTILHRNRAYGVSKWLDVCSEADSVLVAGPIRPTLDIFVTCACHRWQRLPHNLSSRRIFVGHTEGGEFLRFCRTPMQLCRAQLLAQSAPYPARLAGLRDGAPTGLVP
jgi:hypothetical protein